MSLKVLEKAKTGILGFDDITSGGLPKGRPTLVCGGAGSGKTLFAMTFLVNGANQFNEPGVFISFEEPANDLATNVSSLGYEVDNLIKKKSLQIDYIRVERAEILETGDYDLEGLFVRLDYAIQSIGAKRVVLDTLEALFSGFSDPAILRAEFRRLFEWLKEKGVTVVITGEQGTGQFTRYGIEEYVSDCVILLDNRVIDQVATRRMRIVKYRGSSHGTNEYPFLIDESGISVLPITSVRLDHETSNEIVSSGIPQLDQMFHKGGFFKASSILISGLAGTGKTTFASMFANAACLRKEKCLYFAFEESPDQVIRNMLSIGVDLKKHMKSGHLLFQSARPSLYGLEMHLAKMHRDIVNYEPTSVVVDPISAFRGPSSEVHSILLRLIDILKSRGITALFTNLTSAVETMSEADRSISSLMDTWLSLSHNDANGERNRLLDVLKARGMGHSNQLREYEISSEGINIIPAYIGTAGVLTGSARIIQEAHERDENQAAQLAILRREREFNRKQKSIERQIEELRADLEADKMEIETLISERSEYNKVLQEDRNIMQKRRG
ncbi:MAG TPA: circadian clock protein KaiC [Methylotenera sp.]|nr:circadian clock protein KaiC [Methylotenera sp.]